MRRIILRPLMIALLAAVIVPAPAWPRQPGVPAPEQVTLPVEVALDDLHAAYAKPTAEEMTIKLRTPQGSERNESITVRIDPGEPGVAGGPRRVHLELGTLRILLGDGKFVAINTGVPGRYFEKPMKGPPTPAALAELLPPIPLPQLELAAGKPGFSRPTPYTPDVQWNGATADPAARPRVMVISGQGPAGPVTLTANVESGRLTRIQGTIRGREGDTTLDLACRTLDPGDPASWSINTEGREKVAALTDLRPPPPKPPSQIMAGQAVPEMSYARPDLSAWTVPGVAIDQGAGPDAGASPLALVLFRGPAAPERAAVIARDAQAGWAVLRALQLGQSIPGQEGTAAEQIRFASAAAIVIEIADFSRERWGDAQVAWNAAAGTTEPGADGQELMWASSGQQTIDRFQPGAGAVIAVIGPDRILRGVVGLDGRSLEPQRIAAEVRALLVNPAKRPLPLLPPSPTQEPRP
jgi:hypothetical protein